MLLSGFLFEVLPPGQHVAEAEMFEVLAQRLVRSGSGSHDAIIGHKALNYVAVPPPQEAQECQPVTENGVAVQRASMCRVETECVENSARLPHILSRSNVEGFDHQASRTIGINRGLQLLPKFSPIRVGENFLLPSTIQKGSGLTTQTFCQMVIVNAPRSTVCFTPMNVNAGQFDNFLLIEVAHHMVMVEIYGQALSD
jgi:hypothetical protein